MISKIIIGKSFRGCCQYVCKKQGAEILFADGVRTDSVKNMTQDFETIRNMRPGLTRAVLHSSVSFAYDDQERISNDMMIEIAEKYIRKLGLEEHQVICVRHHDAKHEHFHLIVNRVGYQGQIANDSFIKNRGAKACDELEVEYGLTIARGQSQSKDIKHRNAAKNQMKNEVKEAIQKGLNSGISNFSALEKFLLGCGIEMMIQYQSTGRINGLSFKKGNLSIKGSAIDKSLSYKGINTRLLQMPVDHIETIINSKTIDYER